MDKITLGIPIYNAADIIERTILSALNQTYPNIEYIFVDDKGDSMDIVQQVISGHPRMEFVRIIDQQFNQGTGAARNAIITHSTGKYLFTMDCDDIITPDCIDILYKKMMEYPVDFVAASFVRRGLDGKIYPGGCQYEDTLVKDGDYAVAKYRYERGKNIFVATWNKLYRTDFLREKAIHCIPHYLIDDPWFTYQVIICARSCSLISNCTLSFTYNPSSVTSVKEQGGYTEFLGEQYLGTQNLITEYIRLLANQSFYLGALVDLLKMNLYHLYRIYSSPKISQEKRENFLGDFLVRCFCFPKRWNLIDSNLYKLLPLLSFYILPMSVKKTVMRCIVFVDLRGILRHWFHF